MNNMQMKYIKSLIVALIVSIFFYSCSDNEDLNTQTYMKRYVLNEVNEKIEYTVDPNTFCIGFTPLPDTVFFSDSIKMIRINLLDKYNLVYVDTVKLETVDRVHTFFPNIRFDTVNTVVAYTKTKLDYEEAYQLASRIAQESTIQYANPFLIADKGSVPNALTNTFFVKMQSTTNLGELNVLLGNTKTEIKALNLEENTYLIAVTKASKKDALDISNEFFQTRLFKYCQPDFLRIKSPEE